MTDAALANTRGGPRGIATPSRSERGQTPPPRESDQRSRLLRAIVAVVADHGYTHAKVGEIAARAGVSRATFYELFPDKEACFAAAHEQLAAHVAQEVETAVVQAEPSRAAHAAVSAIAAVAEREPSALSFLTHEALLAGPRARALHDRLLTRLEHAIEQSWQRCPPDMSAPDIPAVMLVGGAIRLYWFHIHRHGEPSPELLPALLGWIDAYATHHGPWPRRELLQAAPARAENERSLRRASPRTLPRGRHRMEKEVVGAIQRERIAHATAEAVANRGELSVSVSEIVAAAGISREVFYTHFADKQQALLATHQLLFEQLMAAASSAFLMTDTPWPERAWDAGCACAGVLASNPNFAHFGLVFAYGIGETGVRRIDVTCSAFALFLEEGYRVNPRAARLPRLVSDAIALAVTEAAAFHVRNGRVAELPRLVPAVAYTALAPFIGCAAAGELVDRRSQAGLEASAGARRASPSEAPS